MATSLFRPGATALISGGASGVGFAFARICRSHGMNVALLDINSQNLAAAAKALPDRDSSETETYAMDVTSLQNWQQVGDAVSKKFRTVELLMLNAGAGFTPSTPQSWLDVNYFKKTLEVNTFGMIYGLSVMLPLVQASAEQGNRCAIIMTGSKQGITNPPGNPAYNASKSAVKTLAEHLAHDMRTSGHDNISVHLLVPGWTFTGLSGNPGPTPDEEALKHKKPGAWLPSQVAEYAYQKIANEGKFYIICPDNDVDEALDAARMTYAMGDVTAGRSALSRWDNKYKDEAAKSISADAEHRRK